METNVPAPEHDRRSIWFFDRLDCTRIDSGTTINPVVEGPLQAIDHLLDIVQPKAGVEGSLSIGFAVAIRVLEVLDVGGDCNKEPSLPRHHGGRKTQAVNKCGAVLKESVP